MYFSLCDGIFLNYHWTRECLHQTQLVSANRSCDVYVGIDVHGRGCFGGGGYNCSIVRYAIMSCLSDNLILIRL